MAYLLATFFAVSARAIMCHISTAAPVPTCEVVAYQDQDDISLVVLTSPAFSSVQQHVTVSEMPLAALWLAHVVFQPPEAA
ncbi:MAG: hypothetical protein ACYDBB_14760 [Armatimonadota bacterium]